MDGCVMGLTTVSASVGTPAVSSVVAHSQTVLAQALGLYVVQPLSHSHGLPLGAEEEWMCVRLAEDTFPLVGGSWSGDMDVGPLSVWSRIWSLVLLPGRLLLLGLGGVAGRVSAWSLTNSSRSQTGGTPLSFLECCSQSVWSLMGSTMAMIDVRKASRSYWPECLRLEMADRAVSTSLLRSVRLNSHLPAE